MKLFLSRRYILRFTTTALLVGTLTFTGCQDVVRRLDDKYRPVVPEPVRSVTIVTDGIDSSGVPVRLVNLEVEDLELVARNEGGGEVPFTPTLEADKEHAGLAYIRTPPNGKAIKDFSVTVSLCSKADGTEYASHTFTADRYPYRIYQVGDETYKFELVKMYHCDGGAGNPANNSPTYEPKEMTFNDSIMTLQDGSSDGKQTGGPRDGTTVVCSHTGDKFVNNGYDYFEVKFRSDSNVASVVTLKGAGSFTFAYDSGVLTATGGSGLSADKLKYDDTSADWVTLGFWNSVSDTNCLFVEDYSATAGTANASSLTNNTNHNGVGFACLNVDSDDDSPTEIDYIAFFKRVEQ